jgi:hypothetical protein
MQPVQHSWAGCDALATHPDRLGSAKSRGHPTSRCSVLLATSVGVVGAAGLSSSVKMVRDGVSAQSVPARIRSRDRAFREGHQPADRRLPPRRGVGDRPRRAQPRPSLRAVPSADGRGAEHKAVLLGDVPEGSASTCAWWCEVSTDSHHVVVSFTESEAAALHDAVYAYLNACDAEEQRGFFGEHDPVRWPEQRGRWAAGWRALGKIQTATGNRTRAAARRAKGGAA